MVNANKPIHVNVEPSFTAIDAANDFASRQGRKVAQIHNGCFQLVGGVKLYRVEMCSAGWAIFVVK